MVWLYKSPVLRKIFKSRIILVISSFLLGFLVNYEISRKEISKKEILSKDYASSSAKYNESDVLLVNLIFSRVDNFKKRQTLRETWLSDISTNNDIKYYFVISGGSAKKEQKTSLSVEQEKHNDLLVFNNLEDSFYFLTHKLVASFGWLTSDLVFKDQGKSNIVKPFNNFKFVLKCDDDSFVRITEIIKELKTVFSRKNGENLYWGFFDGRAKVKKSGKYKEDQWNICDYYIPYALGGGYILAKPLIEFIAKNEKYLKKYTNEDVSVGSWLANYADINRVHDPRFDTEYISRGCQQSYLITHKHSETAMRNFHVNLKNTGNLCQKEFRTRMSYVYNWQVIPSKCCARVNPNIP